MTRALHEGVAVAYKDCPTTWRAIEARLQVEGERAALLEALRVQLERTKLV